MGVWVEYDDDGNALPWASTVDEEDDESVTKKDTENKQ